ncbi:MAG: hypothetical protein NZO16_05530 [Deltaproteobacteria bacterium]|nr:hypothetical protein [Deltaproteobacteria bacterium]
MSAKQLILLGWSLIIIWMLSEQRILMHAQQDFYYTFHDAIKLLDEEIPYNRVENLKFNQKYPIYFPAGYLTRTLLQALQALVNLRNS